MIKRMLDLAIEIQQIPAPTFHEEKRAEFVRDLFLKEKLQDVSIDSVNNVFARLPAMKKSKNKKTEYMPLIVSAHLDTVFPIGTSLHVTREADRIYGPGLGDNSVGVAALFGLLWMLRKRGNELPGDVWFVANVCEEGLGDLRGMKAVVGTIRCGCEGLFGNRRYVLRTRVSSSGWRAAISCHGKNCGQGRSWSDYGQPSAVHRRRARVAQKIQTSTIPSHRVHTQCRPDQRRGTKSQCAGIRGYV